MKARGMCEPYTIEDVLYLHAPARSHLSLCTCIDVGWDAARKFIVDSLKNITIKPQAIIVYLESHFVTVMWQVRHTVSE